jgi:hypothetical protein
VGSLERLRGWRIQLWGRLVALLLLGQVARLELPERPNLCERGNGRPSNRILVDRIAAFSWVAIQHGQLPDEVRRKSPDSGRASN